MAGTLTEVEYEDGVAQRLLDANRERHINRILAKKGRVRAKAPSRVFLDNYDKIRWEKR